MVLMSEPLKLWELAGDDPQRVFSPFVWRVRLALFHKQIPYESVCWRYAEKELIRPSQKVKVDLHCKSTGLSLRPSALLQSSRRNLYNGLSG